MINRVKWLYHWIMDNYCGWRKRRYIKELRALGEEHDDLPSLKDYSDDAIVESLRRYHK